MARRSLVIVANRLPVDERCSSRTGRSPGRGAREDWSARCTRCCVTAVARGSAGPAASTRRRSYLTRTASGCERCRSPTTDYENYYEGYSNSTLWPLYHDAVEAAGVPPALVGGVPAGQPALCPGDRGLRRARLDRLGAGLPPAAGPGDAARAATGSAHRLLHAHPVPAGRAVHAAAPAGRAAARACSAPTCWVPDRRRRRQLCPARRPGCSARR